MPTQAGLTRARTEPAQTSLVRLSIVSASCTHFAPSCILYFHRSICVFTCTEADSREGSRSAHEWVDSNMSFPRSSSELKLWSERRGGNIEQTWSPRSNVGEADLGAAGSNAKLPICRDQDLQATKGAIFKALLLQPMLDSCCTCIEVVCHGPSPSNFLLFRTMSST